MEIRGLYHLFSSSNGSERHLFRGLNLRFETGLVHSILGPSGCGKSTLIKILAGLLKPTKGEILGQNPQRRGFVFQDSELLSWRTSLENVRLPLELLGDLNNADERARESLVRVGLEKSLHLKPRQLSGGMKMRVSIARALVVDPEHLFLDEAFSALDEPTRYDLQDLVSSLQAPNRSTFLVTHSIQEALYLGDRILVLGASGQLVADRPNPGRHQRNSESRWSSETLKQSAELASILKDLRPQVARDPLEMDVENHGGN